MGKYYGHSCKHTIDRGVVIYYYDFGVCWILVESGQYGDSLDNILFCPYCGASLLEIYKGEVE